MMTQSPSLHIRTYFSLLVLVIVVAGCDRPSAVDGGTNSADVASEPQPTPASIPSSWGPVILPSWGNGAPGISISVPPGFSTENSKGLDFDVHQIRGPEDTGVLSIYVGHHPNRDTSEAAETLRKHVGNRLIEFARRKTEYGTFTDAIVDGFFDSDGDDGVRGLLLHVFIHAKDDSFYDTVWPMLVSIDKANNSEQAGTGQPATRPESKSEGGDIPQPEAEGRSR